MGIPFDSRSRKFYEARWPGMSVQMEVSTDEAAERLGFGVRREDLLDRDGRGRGRMSRSRPIAAIRSTPSMPPGWRGRPRQRRPGLRPHYGRTIMPRSSAIRTARTSKPSATRRNEVFTIGYEARRSANSCRLTEAGVERNRRPRRAELRVPAFRKRHCECLAEAGIDYVHLRALGTRRWRARRGPAGGDLERIYAGQLELPEAIAESAR